MKKQFQERLVYLGVCFLIFVLDQITKRLIAVKMVLYQSREIIPGFFSLTYIHNKGVIFGIFSDIESIYLEKFLIILSIGSFIIITLYFFLFRHESRWASWAFALVLGGAMGNTWDRLTQGYVVDFLDFYYGPYHWPTFNLADSMITVGVGMLLLHILGAQWHGEKEETEDTPDVIATGDREQ